MNDAITPEENPSSSKTKFNRVYQVKQSLIKFTKFNKVYQVQ